tara:strand:- start:5842 stop:6966 length:1125 start_codon:yes stop_codon:yes gene_type:complete
MAQTIQIKRSTSTNAPEELANGELAYAQTVAAPGKLYIGRPGGTDGDIDAIGGKYYVDRSETAYGWGDHSTEGYLVATSAGYNNTQWDTAYTYSQVGHLPLEGGTLTGNTSLETETNPTITIKSTDTTVEANEVIGTLEFIGTDDQTGGILAGQIQQVAAQGADWGTGNYGSNMSFSIKEAGNGGPFAEKLRLQTSGVVVIGDVTVSGTVDGRDVATDGTKLDAIATSANNYTLANLNAHLAQGVGNIRTSGYIRGPAEMVIDPAGHEDATGSLTILGDLIVEGTTTTINSTVVEIADERVVVNRGQVGVPTVALVAGLEVERGDSNNAYLLWRENDTGWYVSDGGTGTGSDFELLHANNWSTAYTGVVEGGSF